MLYNIRSLLLAILANPHYFCWDRRRVRVQREALLPVVIHLEQGSITAQYVHGIANACHTFIIAINVELELLFDGVGDKVVEEQNAILILNASHRMIVNIGEPRNLVKGIGQDGNGCWLIQIIP